MFTVLQIITSYLTISYVVIATMYLFYFFSIYLTSNDVENIVNIDRTSCCA